MTNTNRRKSQLCPNCRKLISTSVAACPFCGLRRPTSKWKNNILVSGITDGDQLATTLIAVNAVMFLMAIIIDPRLSSFNFSPFHFLSPSNQSLLILGSTGTYPLFQLHHWWSLLTANYLHGSLLHIVFNMLALRQLSPLVIREFGASRMIAIYTIGGAGGFFISSLAGVPFTIGASAAVCSLIGAMLYYGKSRGGIYGQTVFSQIGGWAFGIAIFGFMVPGINNWGHGGGMVAGALLGYLLGYRDRRQETYGHKMLALFCVGATALALLWSSLIGILFMLFR